MFRNTVIITPACERESPSLLFDETNLWMCPCHWEISVGHGRGAGTWEEPELHNTLMKLNTKSIIRPIGIADMIYTLQHMWPVSYDKITLIILNVTSTSDSFGSDNSYKNVTT